MFRLSDAKIFRFICLFPLRLWNEGRYLNGLRAGLNFKKLIPNFELELGRDEDAYSSIDPHAVAIYYQSRGFKTYDFMKRIFFRTGPLIVRALKS